MRTSLPIGILGATLGLALFPSSATTAAPVDGKNCDACKPSKAHWDWKANGYQLGADAEAAETAARQAGTKTACDKSAPFLANNPVKCKPGCEPGEVSNRCEPRQEPKCTSGTYDSDHGMWMFVCRKTRQGKKDAPACDAARQKASPGWGMCDVKVRAVKERACTAPGCS